MTLVMFTWLRRTSRWSTGTTEASECMQSNDSMCLLVLPRVVPGLQPAQSEQIADLRSAGVSDVIYLPGLVFWRYCTIEEATRDREMSEASVVEETFKRLGSYKGVEGALVLNSEGIPIRSTLDSTLSVQYAGLASL